MTVFSYVLWDDVVSVICPERIRRKCTSQHAYRGNEQAGTIKIGRVPEGFLVSEDSSGKKSVFLGGVDVRRIIHDLYYHFKSRIYPQSMLQHPFIVATSNCVQLQYMYSSLCPGCTSSTHRDMTRALAYGLSQLIQGTTSVFMEYYQDRDFRLMVL